MDSCNIGYLKKKAKGLRKKPKTKTNKPKKTHLIATHNSMVEVEEVKRGMVMEGDSTWAGEHTIQNTRDEF